MDRLATFLAPPIVYVYRAVRSNSRSDSPRHRELARGFDARSLCVLLPAYQVPQFPRSGRESLPSHEIARLACLFRAFHIQAQYSQKRPHLGTSLMKALRPVRQLDLCVFLFLETPHRRLETLEHPPDLQLRQPGIAEPLFLCLCLFPLAPFREPMMRTAQLKRPLLPPLRFRRLLAVEPSSNPGF